LESLSSLLMKVKNPVVDLDNKLLNEYIKTKEVLLVKFFSPHCRFIPSLINIFILTVTTLMFVLILSSSLYSFCTYLLQCRWFLHRYGWSYYCWSKLRFFFFFFI
jgi:hypothetical protein